MRSIAIKLVLLVAFASSLIVSIRHAVAVSYNDIKGKWCGSTTNYVFTPNQLTVTFHNGSPTKRFTINAYNYTDSTVVIHWLNDDNKEVETIFGNFRAKGRQISQLADPKDCVASSGCPRREFRRC